MERLRALFDLFAAVLDRLCRIGARQCRRHAQNVAGIEAGVQCGEILEAANE